MKEVAGMRKRTQEVWLASPVTFYSLVGIPGRHRHGHYSQCDSVINQVLFYGLKITIESVDPCTLQIYKTIVEKALSAVFLNSEFSISILSETCLSHLIVHLHEKKAKNSPLFSSRPKMIHAS